MMNTSTTKIATLNSLPANNQCGLRLNIHTATGGLIEINMSEKDTVSSLKWRLSRKLKIPCEKMSLLYKDRPLKEGSLQDNLVTDNSKILLLPNMESGMAFQRPDVGVIQGLENLTESQVNDFLSGRAPLLLVMKLGDHMMFVQLQLSTASCGQNTQTNRSQCDGKEKTASTGPLFNSTALAELGHNLSQKLREFSQLSTHQKVSEVSTTTSPTSASPAGSNTTTTTTTTNTSTYSVSKNVTANGPATNTTTTTTTTSTTSTTHTQPSTPVNNSSDNHNNHPYNPNNTIEASGSSCNPSSTCATTTSSPTPDSRTCPTTGEQIPGAIIESMHHIGQGVFSGTFSGTLDPSLQDNDGKPKRNIGTIIHILNDLLGATPQYRTQNAPHTAEKPLVDSCSHKNSEQSQSLAIGLSEEDNALRGKVKDLQMKMEEKRMRRQARRDAKAPYQCPGPRSNNPLSLPTSTTTTNFESLISTTDHTSIPGDCSTDSELSVFAPPHPECTVTEMDIGDETMTDVDNKNREIEMTAMPTPATATASTSAASASTKATEPSAYANSGLEQESVLV